MCPNNGRWWSVHDFRQQRKRDDNEIKTLFEWQKQWQKSIDIFVKEYKWDENVREGRLDRNPVRTNLRGKEGRCTHSNCNSLIISLHTLPARLIKRKKCQRLGVRKSRHMDNFEKGDYVKEHLIRSGFLSAQSWIPHKSASQTAHDYWIQFSLCVLTEKYTKWSQIVRFDEYSRKHTWLHLKWMQTVGRISDVRPVFWIHVHLVLKGQQTNLFAVVCVLIVNESTKEREKITHCSWMNH